MNYPMITDDQCDQLVVHVMIKIAAQTGIADAKTVDPSIVEHHELRRNLVRFAYMLGQRTAAQAISSAVSPTQST